MSLVIREQRYPTAFGDAPLSYAVYLETEETHDDLEYWQDVETRGIFICYAWSRESAERAIAELEGVKVNE